MNTYIRSIKLYCVQESVSQDRDKFIEKIEKENAKMIKEDGNW